MDRDDFNASTNWLAIAQRERAAPLQVTSQSQFGPFFASHAALAAIAHGLARQPMRCGASVAVRNRLWASTNSPTTDFILASPRTGMRNSPRLRACAFTHSAVAARCLYPRPQRRPDIVVLKPSPLPGYKKAMANCTSCHSAEYMQYQPPTAPRNYWDAMVHRMKTVFKAPVDDVDVADIVDYQAKTYDAEQAK